MVFDTLLKILLSVPRELLASLPTVEIGSIPLPENFNLTLNSMVSTAKHFFPCELLVFICSTMLQLRLIRVQRSIRFPFKV